MSFWNKKQRFSIRKLSIGAVSVLLGVVMTVPLTSETVFADETDSQAAVVDQTGSGEPAPDAEDSAGSDQAYSNQAAAETSTQETSAPADEQELMHSPVVKADKSDLLNLVDQAKGALSKEVSTAGEDPANGRLRLILQAGQRSMWSCATITLP